MAQFFLIHPDNPQNRLILQAVKILQQGGVIIYPTDSCYALGCMMGERTALDRIRDIRHLDKNHQFTLICKDLSGLGTYAQVSNATFRLIKRLTPGPYTFILPGTREVPKRLLHQKRKTIGLRVPDHPILQSLLTQLNEPLMSVSLTPSDETELYSDPATIVMQFASVVDGILDGGVCGLEPTTIIDCTGDTPVLIRQGKGAFSSEPRSS